MEQRQYEIGTLRLGHTSFDVPALAGLSHVSRFTHHFTPIKLNKGQQRLTKANKGQQR
jgi:hypothetical protein